VSRFGSPMASKPSHSVCKVVVTVEWPDGRVEYKPWRGRSAKRIQAKAHETYKGAKLQFGTAIWEHFWGAH
jgi:hypothetical protein